MEGIREPAEREYVSQPKWARERQETIMKLVSIGAAEDEIAYIVGKPWDDIYCQFRAEIDAGRALMKTRIRQQQLDKCAQGDSKMLIHLGKCILGQKEAQAENTTYIVEHVGWQQPDESEDKDVGN